MMGGRTGGHRDMVAALRSLCGTKRGLGYEQPQNSLHRHQVQQASCPCCGSRGRMRGARREGAGKICRT